MTDEELEAKNNQLWTAIGSGSGALSSEAMELLRSAAMVVTNEIMDRQLVRNYHAQEKMIPEVIESDPALRDARSTRVPVTAPNTAQRNAAIERIKRAGPAGMSLKPMSQPPSVNNDPSEPHNTDKGAK